MLNFDFSEKGQAIVSPPHFVHDFSRKMYQILQSIDWLHFVVWLSLLLEILSNMYIVVVCFRGCWGINFEIKLIFLIKPICYMTKKPRQKFKCLKKEKRFYSEIKIIFNHFKSVFSWQKLSDTCKSVFKSRTNLTPWPGLLLPCSIVPSVSMWIKYMTLMSLTNIK